MTSKKDTSVAYMTVLSDYAIAYKQLDQHVIMFVFQKGQWLYVLRYRPDGHVRYIDKHSPSSIEPQLRYLSVDATTGWDIFENFGDQDILGKIQACVRTL